MTERNHAPARQDARVRRDDACRGPMVDERTARAVVLVEGVSDRLAVQALAERRGRNLAAFRFQRQPAWCGRATDAQLRRFLGTYRGRKIQAAPRLVAALDLERVPRPLDRVLGHV